mmetsp:Transcript_43346/g.77917  ORF Transcript_43346/g.77917 Transcript_43346/m.77917 type:complete len:110 (-) Transcript_43346:468-797(-)
MVTINLTEIDVIVNVVLSASTPPNCQSAPKSRTRAQIKLSTENIRRQPSNLATYSLPSSCHGMILLFSRTSKKRSLLVPDRNACLFPTTVEICLTLTMALDVIIYRREH